MKTKLSLLILFVAFFQLSSFANCDSTSCTINAHFTADENWRCEWIIIDSSAVAPTDTCCEFAYSIADYGNGIKDTIYPNDSIFDRFSQGEYTFCLTAVANCVDSLNNPYQCRDTSCTTIVKQKCSNPGFRIKSSQKFDTGYDFETYPNPANDHLTIQLSKNAVQLRLMAIDGKVIHEQYLREQNLISLDLSSYEKGLYLIQVQFPGELKTKKIILN